MYSFSLISCFTIGLLYIFSIANEPIAEEPLAHLAGCVIELADAITSLHAVNRSFSPRIMRILSAREYLRAFLASIFIRRTAGGRCCFSDEKQCSVTVCQPSLQRSHAPPTPRSVLVP